MPVTVMRVTMSEEGVHFDVPNPEHLHSSQLMALIGGLVGTVHVEAASTGFHAALSEQMVDQSMVLAKEGALNVMNLQASGQGSHHSEKRTGDISDPQMGELHFDWLDEEEEG